MVNVIIIAILVVLVVLALYYMSRSKKNGKSCCQSGCSNCPMSGTCHKEMNRKM